MGRVTQRRRQRHPTPVLLPGKSYGRRSLVGCSPWGRWGSYTTERLHFHFSLSFIEEGNGNPLQCSCLENPRDRGAWWAAVYRVAQSRTRLKWLSSSSSSSSRATQTPYAGETSRGGSLHTGPAEWKEGVVIGESCWDLVRAAAKGEAACVASAEGRSCCQTKAGLEGALISAPPLPFFPPISCQWAPGVESIQKPEARKPSWCRHRARRGWVGSWPVTPDSALCCARHPARCCRYKMGEPQPCSRTQVSGNSRRVWRRQVLA